MRRGLFPDNEDQFPVAARRSATDSELDITPMIDVTFLLLIFFMVSSTMQPGDALDIPVARYGVGENPRAAAAITLLAPRPGAAAEILVEGNRPVSIEGVRQFVREQVQRNRRQFLLRAERHVPHGRVQEVMRLITGQEGVQVSIAVEDTEPEAGPALSGS
jgi:biopolymer transport protein ExbD